MRNAATFAEMLEAELKCTDVPPRMNHTSSTRNRPLTTPLFAFDFGARRVLQVCDADPRNAAHARPRTQGSAAPFTKPPSTATIPLSASEKRSMVALNALGAYLGDDLSVATLRRAFRELARRYHPDRHPQSSAAELERLARLFAEATAHYRVLAAALARSG